MSSKQYQAFLTNKAQFGEDSGFTPTFIPEFLFDFQKSLVEWAVRKGRGAIFADCGMGKTPMELTWAENVRQKTNKPVLILTPLSVAHQTAREGVKFGIECSVTRDGTFTKGLNITNYDQLHRFNPADFGGAVCDESSILKNFDGKMKGAITEFMRKMPYRLLCTATAAPNDYVELGTSSEAVGDMGYMDMLGRFFKNDQHSNHPNRMWAGDNKWRFRGHAERDFWRWVCSWARAVRKPSDLGFEDGKFVLPPMETRQHVVESSVIADGCLFNGVASTLLEQRQERRNTLPERCERAAELIRDTGKPAIAWCNLNDEGDLMEKLIPGSCQVSGSDSEDRKEEVFSGFVNGDIRVLVSKPTIAGYGLNFQHCAHQTFFPSHSFEQWYQAIRRSWRFGQENPVMIDLITSDGEAKVLASLQRKAGQAEVMFSRLVDLMNDAQGIKKVDPFVTKQKKPKWL